MTTEEPPFESFWIEADGPTIACVPMLSCRRCGVHHVLWSDGEGEPTTLAAVIELARQHAEVECG